MPQILFYPKKNSWKKCKNRSSVKTMMSKSSQGSDKSLSFDDVSNCFSLPISEAANALGNPPHFLQSICLLAQKIKVKQRKEQRILNFWIYVFLFCGFGLWETNRLLQLGQKWRLLVSWVGANFLFYFIPTFSQ